MKSGRIVSFGRSKMTIQGSNQAKTSRKTHIHYACDPSEIFCERSFVCHLRYFLVQSLIHPEFSVCHGALIVFNCLPFYWLQNYFYITYISYRLIQKSSNFELIINSGQIMDEKWSFIVCYMSSNVRTCNDFTIVSKDDYSKII